MQNKTRIRNLRNVALCLLAAVICALVSTPAATALLAFMAAIVFTEHLEEKYQRKLITSSRIFNGYLLTMCYFAIFCGQRGYIDTVSTVLFVLWVISSYRHEASHPIVPEKPVDLYVKFTQS